MSDIYYIEKLGIYSQGVMWIGENKDVGLEEIKLLNLADRDNYHNYKLFKYSQWTTKKANGSDGIECNGQEIE